MPGIVGTILYFSRDFSYSSAACPNVTYNQTIQSRNPQRDHERMRLLGDDATRTVCGHGQVDLERAAFSDDARVVLYGEDELATDHFAVYRIPIPEPFQTERGERRIRVTLAYDPPVRHTRTDYAGVGMSFRFLRGCAADLIFEHYRKRTKEEGPFPDLAGRFDCRGCAADLIFEHYRKRTKEEGPFPDLAGRFVCPHSI